MIAVVLSFAFFTVGAQGNEADISAFLNAETADANKLINAYTGPAIRVFPMEWLAAGSILQRTIN